MTTPNSALPAGTHAWLESPYWPVPPVVHDLNLTFEHWLHVDTDDDVNGSGGGAWVEVTIDGGTTWTQVTPESGYPNQVSASAPRPHGAPVSSGGGFPAWASVNATGWQQSSFHLDDVPGIANATAFAIRLVIWVPQISNDRPGWFVDTLSVDNGGSPPGAWFHGDLTGEYHSNANASLLLPVDLANASAPLMLEYAIDFDIEGDIYDNLHIEASRDGTNWTSITPMGGIPHHGIYVNGTTFGDDSGGWISLQHSLPATLAGAANASLRFRILTDATPGTGYGGTSIDPPEGVMIDDVRIVEGLGTARSTVREWRFTSGGETHIAHGAAFDEWQHLTNIGHNGPWGVFQSFEDAPLLPDGWSIETVRGAGWTFGPLGGVGTGPSSWTSGQHGVGIVLDGPYEPNTWTHLVSPSLPIPEGSRATLRFNHWICAESGWDAGSLFLSSDGGHTWSHFGSHLTHWYETGQWNNSQSPLYGMLAWDGSQQKGTCHNNRSMRSMSADLSHLAGSDAKLRFSFFSDDLFEHDGWYLDDVGVQVDVFEQIGNWTSPVIADDDPMGWDSLSIDAWIPDGTWVNASIRDSLGRPLSSSGLASAGAWENLTFPIALAGLAEEMRALRGQGATGMDGIRVELHLNTDEVHRTPRLRSLSIGANRIFDAQAMNATGWVESPAGAGLLLDGEVGNLTNPTLMTYGMEGEALVAARPIESLRIEVEGAGVLLDLFDEMGVVAHSGMALNGVVTLSEPVMSLRPRIDLQPGGWLSRLSIAAITADPAIDASLDALDDGSDEWSWPQLPQHGPHGWQTQFALGAGGEPLLDLDGLPTNRTVGENSSHRTVEWDGVGTLTLPILLPSDARGTGSGALLIRDFTSPPRSITVVSAGNGSHAGTTVSTSGTAILPFYSSSLALIEPVNSSDGVRTWDLHHLALQTSVPGALSITLLGFEYPLVENITGLSTSLEIWRNASLSSGSIDENLPVPITFDAVVGGVEIDGGIIQQPAIHDNIDSLPSILLPGREARITTSHQHLFSTASIRAASLSLHAPDGRVWGFSVDDVNGAPQFIQIDDPAGTGTGDGIKLDANSSSVTVVGDAIEIEWVIRPEWTVDDASEIVVLAEAIDIDGSIWGPARDAIGAGGTQAMENDLEIVAWTVVDETGRDLLATWDSRHPFYVQPGAEIEMSGRVRFEGVGGLGANPSDWSAAIEIADEFSIWKSNVEVTDADGSWSTTVTVPTNISANTTELTMRPGLIRVGPADRSRIGAEDVTSNSTVTTLRIDRVAPTVGPLLAQIGGGLRPIDGNTWSPTRPLVLAIHLTEPERFGSTIRLFEWHESIDDLDGDGVADSHEYSERVRMLGSSTDEIIEIDLGAIDLASSCCGDLISFYVEGADHANRSLIGGGSAGLSTDLATLTIEADEPTVSDRDGITLDRADDAHLLLGIEHTLSFTLSDPNGISSIDEVAIHLAGEAEGSDANAEAGVLHWDPLLGTLTSDDESGVQPRGAEVEHLNDETARIHVRFALTDLAPSIWRVDEQTPSIVVTEEGARLDISLDMLPDLAWRLDSRTLWLIDAAEDLTAPFGQYQGGRLHLHDGDSVRIRAHLVHERTGARLDAPPVGRSVDVDAGDGATTVRVIGEDGNLDLEIGIPSSGGIDGDSMIVARPRSISEVGWPALQLPLVLDRTPPTIIFHTTSLVTVHSDSLSEQLVAFTIRDDGGMGDGTMQFNWRFQRSGLEMLGMSGISMVGPASDRGNLWDVSERVDMRVPNLSLLRDGDQVVIWIEGSDLAGNPIVGEGSFDSPRAPHLRIVWFEPSIDTVLIAPQPAIFGKEATIDVRLRDLGNRGGQIDLSLWAWEDDGSGVRWIEMGRSNVTIPPAGVAEARFKVETWREGDLAMLLAIDEKIEDGRALPSLHVDSAARSEGVFGSAAAGDVTSIGLLILVFTGLGFLLGMLVLRPQSDEVDWDDLDDIDHAEDGRISTNRSADASNEEMEGSAQAPPRPKDIWPSPPDIFPDESAESEDSEEVDGATKSPSSTGSSLEEE